MQDDGSLQAGRTSHSHKKHARYTASWMTCIRVFEVICDILGLSVSQSGDRWKRMCMGG